MSLGFLFVFAKYAILRLEQPDNSREMVSTLFTLLSVINTTWFLARSVSVLIVHYLSPKSNQKTNKLDAHLSSLLQKISVYIIWILGFVAALNTLGVKVSALVAGLGIGSMAFALAAQDTIKNLFGGLTLFVDRPFRIGDRIKIDDVDGFVADIGMRSLRIKTLDNRIVSLPNSKVVDSTLENVTSQPSFRMKTKIGLTYDTTPQKMSLAMQLLKTLPQTVDGIEKDVEVSFFEYGDFSMQILLIYYIKPSSNYFGSISDVNMEILRMFNENSLEFAFPTQTIYMKQ